MNPFAGRFALLTAIALALPATALCADPDDDDKAPAGTATLPTLNVDQQRAAGVVVAHPANASAAQRDDAIGLVLDPLSLVADAGEVDASAAGARAANSELERVRALGCTDVQGFLYSRPVPVRDLTKLLNEQSVRKDAAA